MAMAAEQSMDVPRDVLDDVPTATADLEDGEEQEGPNIPLTLTYKGKDSTQYCYADSTMSDLSQEVEHVLNIPAANQKFDLGKLGFHKQPFKDPNLLLSSIPGMKVKVYGSSVAEVQSVREAPRKAMRFASAAPRAKANKYRDVKREWEEAEYTFHELKPLQHLPNPSRSLRFLQRLKADLGIKATMRKHKWSVPILTEMDPMEHTVSNHEGTTRTLGLNENAGQRILLRLRTDAYDGYRDYKTILKTLCHELTHNVHGPHDRPFWDLCHQVEREVSATNSAHTLSTIEFHHPAGESDDQHSWQGGERTLGGLAIDDSSSSLRERRAKAAEARRAVKGTSPANLGPIQTPEVLAIVPDEGISRDILRQYFSSRIGSGLNQTSRDDFDKMLRESCTLDVASDSVYKT